MVALSIVRRDRSKEDWTDARKIKTWTGFSSDAPGGTNIVRKWTISLNVVNNSDRSIFDVKLRVLPKSEKQLKGRDSFDTEPIDELHPGENKVVSVTIDGPEAKYNHLSVADMIDDVVYFTSENGITWEKSSRGVRLRMHQNKGILRRILGW